MEGEQLTQLIIGMNCNETARFSECYASLMAMWKPEGTKFVQGIHGSVAKAMNTNGEFFLSSGAEWLFLTNDDHIYPYDTLQKLLAHDKDIVSGLYLRRSLPYEPVLFEAENEKGWFRPYFLRDGVTGLVPVLAAGSGALLIRRKVLETIPRPWWELATIAPDLISEDLTFCHKARDHGFEVWCDLDVKVGHIGLAPIFPTEVNGKWATLLMQGEGKGLGLPAARAPKETTT